MKKIPSFSNPDEYIITCVTEFQYAGKTIILPSHNSVEQLTTVPMEDPSICTAFALNTGTTCSNK